MANGKNEFNTVKLTKNVDKFSSLYAVYIYI